MTEPVYVPPPPPPPPPSQPRTGSFDFLRPITFTFDDPKWISKILIGGLFYIAAFFIIGIFFLLGYFAQLARNVIAGMPHPLPEWDDLGNYFGEGLRLFGVVFVYSIPLIFVALAVMVPMIALSAAAPHDDIAQAFTGGAMSFMMCMIIPVSLAWSFFIPAALLFAVVENRFGAAFEFARIFTFIKLNIGNYVLAFVVALIARFAAPLGFVLFCVGIVFTAFWAMAVATYGFSETFRLSKPAA